MTDARGVPVAMTITAANIDERISIHDLLHNVNGLLKIKAISGHRSNRIVTRMVLTYRHRYEKT